MPTYVSDNYAVRSSPVTVGYTSSYELVLEIDVLSLLNDKFADWEGYIYVAEVSGNQIDYELRSVVSGIEVVESSGSISGNSSARLEVSVPVVYRLYVKSSDGTSTGNIKIAYTIVPYRC